MQIPDEQALSLKLFVVLSKAYKVLEDFVAKDMKTYGISASEFNILVLLYEKGQMQLQQIGEKTLVTSGSITYNIDKLEQRKWIQRMPSSTDRRVIFAQITPEGAELFQRIFPAHADAIHSVMESVTSEEKEAAIELLKKLGLGIRKGQSS